MSNPVKGEKSLALMQRSLLGKQEESNTTQGTSNPPPPTATATATAIADTGGSIVTNPLQHGQIGQIDPVTLVTATTVANQGSNPVLSSTSTNTAAAAAAAAIRSKGKDIAQLQRLSPDKVSTLQKSLLTQLQSQPSKETSSSSSSTLLQQEINPNTTTATTATATLPAMKSKGKDFASMMSRAPPSVHANIDLNRQNAARKAAGLPPLFPDAYSSSSSPSDIGTHATSSMMQNVGSQSKGGVVENQAMVQIPSGGEKSQLQLHSQSQLQKPQLQIMQPQQPQYSLHEASLGINNSQLTLQQPQPQLQPQIQSQNQPQNQQLLQQPQMKPEVKVIKPKPTPKPTKVEGIMSISSSSSSSSNHSSANNLTRQQSLAIRVKLSNMLKSLDPSGLFSLDADAEEKLVSLANEFANNLVKKSQKVANHRHSSSSYVINVNGNDHGIGENGNGKKKRKCVEVEDVAFVLKKNYGMTIPGLPSSHKKRGGGGGFLSSISTSSKGVSLATARVLGSVLVNNSGDGNPNVTAMGKLPGASLRNDDK